MQYQQTASQLPLLPCRTRRMQARNCGATAQSQSAGHLHACHVALHDPAPAAALAADEPMGVEIELTEEEMQAIGRQAEGEEGGVPAVGCGTRVMPQRGAGGPRETALQQLGAPGRCFPLFVVVCMPGTFGTWRSCCSGGEEVWQCLTLPSLKPDHPLQARGPGLRPQRLH